MANNQHDEQQRRRSPLAIAVDRALPPSRVEAGGDDLRRLRIVTTLLLMGLTFIPLRIVWTAWNGPPDLLMLLIGVWTTVLVLLVLIRRGLDPSIAGNGFVLLGMVGTTTASLLHGAMHATSILAPLVAPMVATLVSGRRSGWLWCGVSLATIALLWSQTAGDPSTNLNKALALAFGAVLLTVIANTFESLREQAIAEMQKARDAATAAAESKGRFLANMSHEIRTPMNGVLGMLGILLDTPLSKDQRDYAQTAHTSGIALLDLLNDILDFSKMEARQMELEVGSFDLRSLLEDLLDQMAVLADTQGLELVAHYVPGTPTHVVGDAGRVRQILLNLVGNAIKFTDEGHVLVTIEHVPHDEGPPRFRCSVEDTGIGIPESEQHAVFEQFQQVDESTARTRAGTGLGLTIVRELVHLMGGELTLRSTPGRGSTFSFELALPVSEDAAPEPAPPPAIASLRILVVDDHRINTWVLHEQLAPRVQQVDQCSNGPRALERLADAHAQGTPFDVLILDYHMPGMDGLELARAIRDDPTLHDVVVIMLSSVTNRVTAPQLYELGIAAYLVKPIHQSELVDVLATAWSQRQDAIERPPIRHAGRHAARREPTGPKVVAQEITVKYRVLVAEDNAINQKVARRMLADLGCRVDVAGDGREALELIDMVPYDLVLMDVQMPQMDGIEATTTLRQREHQRQGPRVPVVAMTAYAMDSDRQRCLAAGMDDHLSKPIQRRDLARVLRQLARPRAESEDDAAAEIDMSQPCDLRWLARSYGDDREELRGLVTMFIERAEQLLKQMATAARDDDPEAFHRAAHDLRGNSGAVGAGAILQVVDAHRDPHDLPTIEAAFARTRQYLVQQLGLELEALDSRDRRTTDQSPNTQTSS